MRECVVAAVFEKRAVYHLQKNGSLLQMGCAYAMHRSRKWQPQAAITRQRRPVAGAVPCACFLPPHDAMNVRHGCTKTGFPSRAARHRGLTSVLRRRLLPNPGSKLGACVCVCAHACRHCLVVCVCACAHSSPTSAAVCPRKPMKHKPWFGNKPSSRSKL